MGSVVERPLWLTYLIREGGENGSLATTCPARENSSCVTENDFEATGLLVFPALYPTVGPHVCLP